MSTKNNHTIETYSCHHKIRMIQCKYLHRVSFETFESKEEKNEKFKTEHRCYNRNILRKM